eukprot:121508-Chlamydomonas_euryale.AAC.1
MGWGEAVSLRPAWASSVSYLDLHEGQLGRPAWPPPDQPGKPIWPDEYGLLPSPSLSHMSNPEHHTCVRAPVRKRARLRPAAGCSAPARRPLAPHFSRCRIQTAPAARWRHAPVAASPAATRSGVRKLQSGNRQVTATSATHTMKLACAHFQRIC